MSTLNTTVREVVESFMKDEELFTALDVSNKVKLSQPFARHGEVRDVVRDLFTTLLQPASWARTPIQVTLADGSQQTALLYHPLSASWDLDDKYDTQKRQQAAIKAAAPVATHVATPKFGWNGTPPQATATPVTTPVAAPVATPVAIKDQWANLFNSQPSLFPRK